MQWLFTAVKFCFWYVCASSLDTLMAPKQPKPRKELDLIRNATSDGPIQAPNHCLMVSHRLSAGDFLVITLSAHTVNRWNRISCICLLPMLYHLLPSVLPNWIDSPRKTLVAIGAPRIHHHHPLKESVFTQSTPLYSHHLPSEGIELEKISLNYHRPWRIIVCLSWRVMRGQTVELRWSRSGKAFSLHNSLSKSLFLSAVVRGGRVVF